MAADLDRDSREKARTTRELIGYFALTFAITYGLGAAFIFARPQLEALLGHIASPSESWLYYLAVCAPTISAVVVSFASRGPQGVARLFSGLIRPFRLRWAFAALLTIPVGLLVWGLVERVAAPSDVAHAIDFRALALSPLLWFTTAAIFVDPGPWGEETGWRGFALPRLLTRLSPLSAALLLGSIWSLWHAPAFFVSGLSQFGLNFAWFMIGGICLTVFMTWIYVNANRNYLLAGVIPHLVSNHMFQAHVYSAVRIEALLYLAIAGLIVARFGPSLRGWGETPDALRRSSQEALT